MKTPTFLKYFVAALISISLSGCTTMGLLSESKDHFEKGNYGTGLYTGVAGLTLGPIVDIVTFGGTMSAEEGTALIATTATTLQNTKNANNQNQINQIAYQSNDVAYPQSYPQKNPTVKNNERPSMPAPPSSIKTNNQGGQSGQSGQSANRTSPNVNDCIDFREHPTISSYEEMVNVCSFAVIVTHCSEGIIKSGDLKGRMVNDCSKRIIGMTKLSAGESTVHNPYKKGLNNHYIACKDPYYVTANRLQWKGPTTFSGKCQDPMVR